MKFPDLIKEKRQNQNYKIFLFFQMKFDHVGNNEHIHVHKK